MYIPNKNTMAARPSMIDHDEDELGFRFNMTRMSPYQYHNPLKAYPNLPHYQKVPLEDMRKKYYLSFHKKWRRMSQAKRHAAPLRNK